MSESSYCANGASAKYFTEQINKLTAEILELEDELEALRRIDTYYNGIDPKLKTIIDSEIKTKEKDIKSHTYRYSMYNLNSLNKCKNLLTLEALRRIPYYKGELKLFT